MPFDSSSPMIPGKTLLLTWIYIWHSPVLYDQRHPTFRIAESPFDIVVLLVENKYLSPAGCSRFYSTRSSSLDTVSAGLSLSITPFLVFEKMVLRKILDRCLDDDENEEHDETRVAFDCRTETMSWKIQNSISSPRCFLLR